MQSVGNTDRRELDGPPGGDRWIRGPSIRVSASYAPDESGDLHEQRFTQAQFSGSAGFGFGGSFERRGLPLRIVARMEALFSAPYMQGSAVDFPVSLRVSYRFGGKR